MKGKHRMAYKRRKILIGGGLPAADADPYGNAIVSQNDDNITQVSQAGQKSADPAATGQTAAAASSSGKAVSGKVPITSGITKNIKTDKEYKSFFAKLFQTLFNGIPYVPSGNITMFQVFPDFGGTALTSLGNACDQVIVYGKLKNGVVSENNDVEVYGKRDSSNNIVAKEIRNVATGTTITPEGVIPAGVIWGILFAVLLILAVIFLRRQFSI